MSRLNAVYVSSAVVYLFSIVNGVDAVLDYREVRENARSGNVSSVKMEHARDVLVSRECVSLFGLAFGSIPFSTSARRRDSSDVGLPTPRSGTHISRDNSRPGFGQMYSLGSHG